MNWGSPEFVLAIIALWTVGSLANNWIRARHGYELENDDGNKSPPPQSDSSRQLATENAELREQVAHFADRVKVLERIVTDRGYGLAGEIEALRDTRSNEALIAQREPEVRS